MKLIFDIETDGFKPSRLHSLVLIDPATAEVFSCTDQPNYPPIALGLELLAEAEEVIGHGIIAFDLRIIANLHKLVIPREKVVDTLVKSRVLWPDQKESDAEIADMPSKLHNKHSLEAWGWRLGQKKADFGTDFRNWSQRMQEYCEDDVITTTALWLHITATEAARA